MTRIFAHLCVILFTGGQTNETTLNFFTNPLDPVIIGAKSSTLSNLRDERNRSMHLFCIIVKNQIFDF